MALFRLSRGFLHTLTARSFTRRVEKLQINFKEELKVVKWRNHLSPEVRERKEYQARLKKLATKPLDPKDFEHVFVPFLLASLGQLGNFGKISDQEIIYEPDNPNLIDRFITALNDSDNYACYKSTGSRQIHITSPDSTPEFKERLERLIRYRE